MASKVSAVTTVSLAADRSSLMDQIGCSGQGFSGNDRPKGFRVLL